MEMSHNARVKFKNELAKRVSQFYNDCHAEDGRFCEVHGVYHSDEGQPTGHDLWMQGRKKKAGLGPVKSDKEEDIDQELADLLGEVEGLKKKAKTNVASEIGRQAKDAIRKQEDARRNEHGFTPEQLETEKKAIHALFDKGNSRNILTDSWTAHADAEVRAQALLQGRIADKREIKKNRDKERGKNWGGLLAIGIAAHYLRK